MAQVHRLTAGGLMRSGRRGLQHLAVLREEGELIGYWTRPTVAAATDMAGVSAATLTADHNKCRVVVERFNLAPLPANRWEEGGSPAVGGQSGTLGIGCGSLLVPKL